jgi:hypothetical protein
MATDPLHELGIVALSIVRVGRCHVREYLGAVYTAPVECRMGKGIDVVPGKLLLGIANDQDSPSE